jgi:hypothetical protein
MAVVAAGCPIVYSVARHILLQVGVPLKGYLGGLDGGGEKEDHRQEEEGGCGAKRVREKAHGKPLGAEKGEGQRNESEKRRNGETMKSGRGDAEKPRPGEKTRGPRPKAKRQKGGNKKAQGTRCEGQGQEIKEPYQEV